MPQINSKSLTIIFFYLNENSDLMCDYKNISENSFPPGVLILCYIIWPDVCECQKRRLKPVPYPSFHEKENRPLRHLTDKKHWDLRKNIYKKPLTYQKTENWLFSHGFNYVNCNRPAYFVGTNRFFIKE